jgi:methylated-DNA-[protein]-cysteine S-methyltransferase
MKRNNSDGLAAANAGYDDKLVEALVREARKGIERAMRIIRRPQARVSQVDSPIGELLIAESDRGIAAVHFLAVSPADATLDALKQRYELVQNEPATRRVERELQRYFAGETAALDRPVDLSLVDGEFQRRALKQLRTVPPGAVITYQGLAAAIGAPSAQRAVGTSMARNPVPIYVPCHRVVKSDGTVGNYGGGAARKLQLLEIEGFRVGRDRRIPAEAVLGHVTTRIYCLPGCTAAERASTARLLVFADPAHARGAGMRACKVCRPA